LADNRLAHCWNLSPEKALDRAIKTFGPNVHIEAGVAIITQLISAGRVDALELSITPATGGEDFIDVNQLLSHFSHRSEAVNSGTRFVSAKK
jgi:dihydrofolate reductase